MALLVALLFFDIVAAVPGLTPWFDPQPTPLGLMATAGISPRPTNAPGFNDIPKGLRPRQNVQYPPPLNWCGFVSSSYNDPLSCSANLVCAVSGAALGCCPATTGVCTALYTTCYNFGDLCDAACEADNAIRKWPIIPVEFLADFYLTAIGSTLVPTSSISVFLGPSSAAASASVPSSLTVNTPDLGQPAAATPTSGGFTSASTGISSSNNNSNSGGGLSQTAIDGIAAGVSVGGILVFALIVFFCLRRRKQKRLAASRAAYPAMQQQQPAMHQQPPAMQQPMPPKAFDGYQSVPQHELPVNQQYQQYPSPSMEQKPQYATQPTQQPQGYFPPPTSTGTPAPTEPRRESEASQLFSPVTTLTPDGTGRQSYYKAPISPTVTEVDGTLGNPGNVEPHGMPREVDATMGNPSVPVGGHGLQLQGMAGGSPSATEIEARPASTAAGQSVPGAMGGVQGQAPGGRTSANLAGPWGADIYEMGDEQHH